MVFTDLSLPLQNLFMVYFDFIGKFVLIIGFGGAIGLFINLVRGGRENSL
jgi:hypothetical protein